MKNQILLLLALLLCASGRSQISQNISLIGHWKDSTLISAFGNQYNEVWGFVQNGVEYGVIGSTEGYHIIDLSDPGNPVEADRVYGESSFVIHRDMHDHDGYLYMVSDEDVRLKIADLSYLPDSVHVVYDSQEHFTRAHNIFIDSTSGLLYVFASTDSNLNFLSTVLVLEFDPLTNTVAYRGDFQPAGSFINSHDGYVDHDTAFINMWSDGLYMVDFHDPANPVTIGQFPFYPGSMANHSGWLDPERHLYTMADEVAGTDIKVMDVSDPGNITLVHGFLGTSNTDVIPHNLMVDGRFLFLSAYNDGLRVFDLYDPANPVLAGFYDTYPGSDFDQYEGAWGVYSLLPSGLVLISDQRTGLYIFDVGPALARENRLDTQLEVWPVPSHDRVRMTWAAENIQPTSFRLLDVKGMVLSEKTLDPFAQPELEVDLSTAPAGVYFLELEGADGKKAIEKIMKH